MPSRKRVPSEPTREILFSPETIAKKISADVSATWSWYDETQGLVEWTFANNAKEQKTVILLRNGYFFGGAFWPVYVENAEFGTSFATALSALADQGVQNNSPPLGIVDIGQGKPEVYFLFTLSAGEVWSMLEGGFSAIETPAGIAVYEVTLKNTGEYCVGYDPQRVADWDLQTGTNLEGYSPNPGTFNTVEVLSESDTPYDVLPYNDTIVPGACAPQPTPSPTPNPCLSLLEEAGAAIESGNLSEAIQDLFEAIKCLLSH